MIDDKTRPLRGTAVDNDDARGSVALLIYHRAGGQMAVLHEGQSIVAGRARPADIAIRDSSLSRSHARFELADGQVTVEDLNSKNGTFINGKKVRCSPVNPGDEVRLGLVAVTLHGAVPPAKISEGLWSFDRFITQLDDEVERAREFARKLSVIMIQASKGRVRTHVSQWCPVVQGCLRPIDRAGLYGPDTLVLSLPELDSSESQALAQSFFEARQRGGPTLQCGIAIFPDSARSSEELISAARLALRETNLRQPISIAPGSSTSDVPVPTGEQLFVGTKMKALYKTLERIAAAELPVLITGETGTGKEVFARALHRVSSRRKQAMRSINCAAIPEQLAESILFGHERGAFTGADQQSKGLFEEADGGMVLLDEVGELSASAQAILLRVLETKRVTRVGSSDEIAIDVRVVAATHRDLESAIEAGTFRRDLYFRLNAMTIDVPPLRDRRDEIEPLVELFVKQACKACSRKIKGLEPRVLKLFMQYGWPGNVRELKNVIERAVAIAPEDIVTIEDLPDRLRKPRARVVSHPESYETDKTVDFRQRVKNYEARIIVECLEANDWNQTRTAQAMGIPLRTLVHKIKTYKISKSYQRSGE